MQPAGQRAIVFPDSTNPRLIAPVYAYTGDAPTQVGSVILGSGNSPTATASPTSSSASSVSLPTPTSSVSKPSPFTSIPSAPDSTAPPSVYHQPVSSYSSVFLPPVSSSAPHQVVSSSHGTSSTAIPVPHTSTATQPTATQVDDDPCDPEPTSHSVHVPSTTSHAQPTETQGDDDDDDDDEPCDSEPTPTHNVHVPSSTSFVQPTGAQSNNDEPCYSGPASSHSAPVPSTTSYAHTIPATTIKHPFLSVPSISVPSFAIPTLSMPLMPGVGSPVNGSSDGNVHAGVGSGLNPDMGSGSGYGSGSGSSVPHYNNNPGVHIPMPASVPNGHGMINNNPATDSDGSIVPGSSNIGKPRRCPSRRTKRNILAEKFNVPVPVKGVRNATPVSSNLKLHHVHHSRRRFGKNFDRD